MEYIWRADKNRRTGGLLQGAGLDGWVGVRLWGVWRGGVEGERDGVMCDGGGVCVDGGGGGLVIIVEEWWRDLETYQLQNP